ncbi:MAG: hypothetical protein AAFY78_08150 [Cyanobacteria bacterium J06648_16]
MQPSLVQEARQAVILLSEYAFELGWQSPQEQVLTWLETYRPGWIRDAVIEALHQGRYKTISVQQILALWQRRGQPTRHFTKEFERTVGLPVGLQLTATLYGRLPTEAEGARQSAEVPAAIAYPADVPISGAQLSTLDGAAESEPLEDARTANASQLAEASPITDPVHLSAERPNLLRTNYPADQGVLTSAHRPIQPFRPQLPFPSHRHRR